MNITRTPTVVIEPTETTPTPNGRAENAPATPTTPASNEGRRWEDLNPEQQREIAQQVVSMVFDPVKEAMKGFG